jgi:hypothetical protein
LNCEDLTPQDIYDTIITVVDESVEYHKKYLTKSIELLSLLKGHRPSFEIDTSLDDIDASSGVSSATKKDWVDFWEETYRPEQYTEEEMNAMCDAAADKEKCREYNMREAEYYDKRAKLDASYDEMVAKGYTMTADGFWIKETEKGVATVSTKPDPYAKLIKEAGGYEWTPGMKSAGYNV